MKRSIHTLGILVCLSMTAATGYGQQRMVYSQYMFNPLAINPAYAGTDKYLNATVQARQQWIGFHGAPGSQMVSIHAPVPAKKVGLGLLMQRETGGVTDLYNVYAMYAYRIKLRDKHMLSLGLQAGVTTYREQLTDLTLPSGTADPNFSANTTYTQPNVGVGIYYYTPSFYAGLSVPTLLQNMLNRDNPLTLTEARHYFLMCGYIFDLSRSLKLKPNVIIKSVVGAPVNVDLNLNLLIDKVVWVGCSYRIGNSVTPIVEIQASAKLRIGFSYDVPLSSLTRSAIRSGSPEVMINYRLVKARPHVVVSPRYF
jgi:type IX secretion system PorP/SprF family membrane protein